MFIFLSISFVSANDNETVLGELDDSIEIQPSSNNQYDSEIVVKDVNVRYSPYNEFNVKLIDNYDHEPISGEKLKIIWNDGFEESLYEWDDSTGYNTYIDMNVGNYALTVFLKSSYYSAEPVDVNVKITKAPAGYGDGYLLLAAFDKENFYRQDKVWSEIYEFSADKKSYSTYVSQNTRLVNSQGVFRQDWIMMTDEFMANLGDAKYFMSSRYYTEDETGIRTDIMKYSNAYRPEIIKKDIYGTWFVNDGDGMHFLRKTEKGFESVATDGKGKEKKVAEFDGDLFEDYLRSGNFVVCKKDRKVTDLLSGDTLCQLPLEISEMTMFSIGPDRTKAVLACASENEQGTPVQTVVYVPLNGSSSPVRYSEPLLRSEGTDFVWIDGSTVMSARPSNDSGLQVCSVIYRFSA